MKIKLNRESSLVWSFAYVYYYIFIIIGLGYQKKTYKLIQQWWQDLGPIFSFKFFNINMLVLCDPDDIKQLLRSEPKYPERIEFQSWIHYREIRNEELGVLLA